MPGYFYWDASLWSWSLFASGFNGAPGRQPPCSRKASNSEGQQTLTSTHRLGLFLFQGAMRL